MFSATKYYLLNVFLASYDCQYVLLLENKEFHSNISDLSVSKYATQLARTYVHQGNRPTSLICDALALTGSRALLGSVARRFKSTRDLARDGLRWPLLEIWAYGGGHGSARPVITLVLILLSPVLFVSFILFYFYILYRCKLFLFPRGWILLCFRGLIFCSVLVSDDEIKKINQSDFEMIFGTQYHNILNDLYSHYFKYLDFGRIVIRTLLVLQQEWT